MKVSTFRMMEALGKADALQTFALEYREEFFRDPAHVYLARIMEAKNVSVAQLCERSGLGNYGYKLVSGTRNPSRDAALRLVIGLGMDVEQAQQYLRLAHLARLDPRCYRDAAVIFALGKQWDLSRTQALLSELGEPEL